MKIIADQKIPGLAQLGSHSDMTLLPSDEIPLALHKREFAQVEGLIIRSIQRVNFALLENTAIQWVATPSSGTDHIDKDYLDARNIALFSAPGSNAVGVADYILWMVAYFEKKRRLPRSKKTAGIIGAGHVGTRVQKMLTLLGFDVLMYDPPKGIMTDLNAVAACDLICVHPSLSHEGLYPSYHLLSYEWFQKLNEKSILINASRGAVIDTQALWEYVQNHPEFYYGLDVFENEPFVMESLVQRSFIATPHIAGHTIESFYRASYKITQDIFEWNKMNIPLESELFNSQESMTVIDATRCQHWYDVVLALYPFQSSIALTPMNFYDRRNDYRSRHDFSCISVKISYALPEVDRSLLRDLSLCLQLKEEPRC